MRRTAELAAVAVESAFKAFAAEVPACAMHR
jgi:hypothetical protein